MSVDRGERGESQRGALLAPKSANFEGLFECLACQCVVQEVPAPALSITGQNVLWRSNVGEKAKDMEGDEFVRPQQTWMYNSLSVE